jgi:hypothetical protein
VGRKALTVCVLFIAGVLARADDIPPAVSRPAEPFAIEQAFPPADQKTTLLPAESFNYPKSVFPTTTVEQGLFLDGNLGVVFPNIRGSRALPQQYQPIARWRVPELNAADLDGISGSTSNTFSELRLAAGLGWTPFFGPLTHRNKRDSVQGVCSSPGVGAGAALLSAGALLCGARCREATSNEAEQGPSGSPLSLLRFQAPASLPDSVNPATAIADSIPPTSLQFVSTYFDCLSPNRSPTPSGTLGTASGNPRPDETVRDCTSRSTALTLRTLRLPSRIP